MLSENVYFIAFVSMIILLYSASIRPNLPPFIKKLFNNPLFRIFYLFLIFNNNVKPTIALSLAICFYVIISMLKEQEINEHFQNTNF
jgi:hypothetical protein